MKDVIISRLILESFYEKLEQCLDLDVAIAGAGPSGLAMASELSKQGLKVAIFEAKNAPGGGIWGGGMMFNEVILEQDLADFLNQVKINHKGIGEFIVVDAVHFASGLIYTATKNGAKIFNNIFVEDLAMKDGRVRGVVINWAPTIREKLHVDPITIGAKFVVDGTGHPADLVRLLTKRGILATLKDSEKGNEYSKIAGYEFPMDAEEGEKFVVENTCEIYPGLIVIGMAAVSVGGGPRMGPIFGGMIRSGLKAAELVITQLRKEVVSI